MRLIRIEPFSVAKIIGVIYAILGFVMGVIFSVSAALLPQADMIGMGNMMAIPGYGYLAWLVWPIAYGITGFISALVFAALYNVLSRSVGQIEVELK